MRASHFLRRHFPFRASRRKGRAREKGAHLFYIIFRFLALVQKDERRGGKTYDVHENLRQRQSVYVDRMAAFKAWFLQAV